MSHEPNSITNTRLLTNRESMVHKGWLILNLSFRQQFTVTIAVATWNNF